MRFAIVAWSWVVFTMFIHGAAAEPTGAPSHPASDRPNILWIGVDQMRYDTPGYSGNRLCRTPNLDRLAQAGVSFTRARTTCCICTPARASMYTGRYAFHHGMGTNCDLYHALASELPEPGMLLHRRLKDLGYRCGFAGKWHVGTKLGPADHGFEGMSIPGYGDVKKYPGFAEYLKDAGLTYGAVREPIFGNPGQKTLLAGRWDGSVQSTPAYYLADYTIHMLDDFAASKRPFLMICQFWGPHSPHLPSPEFAGRHDRTLIEPWINFRDDYSGKPAALRRFRSGFYRSLPEDWSGWQEIVGLYYDYTAMIDEQIGRILDHLDKLGLTDKTIVVFESDHGDMLGSHGGLFDKGFMYEEDYRIPMIISAPGRFRGNRTCDELVYNMDIMPTILDVLGRPDGKLDGISLRACLEEREFLQSRDAIYTEFHGIRHLSSQRALVTRDGYKYIFSPDDFDEVYDLNDDPGEMRNLINSAAHADLVRRLRDRIRIEAARVKDPIADYVAKLFGDWENLSGQFEAASFVPGQKGE